MKVQKYRIVSALNLNKVLEIVPFAQSVKLNDTDPNNQNQVFFLFDNIHSKYIVCHANYLCIKSQGQRSLSVGNVIQSPQEEWIFIAANGNNGYHIKNRSSGKVIDIPGSNTQSGTIVN